MLSVGVDQDGKSIERGRDAAPPGASTAEAPPRVAASLARRLLTLAATRRAAGACPWEWAEVERIALRIVAVLEDPADRHHGS